MRKAIWAIALFAAACSANGVRTEDGTINLGPNVFGDDPIHHKPYRSYADYAVATGELKEMEEDGFGKEEQICFATVFLDNLPPAVSKRLNQYATGEIVLMESEYAGLSKEVERFSSSKEIMTATAADFRSKCNI
jgi:hypothetical protein